MKDYIVVYGYTRNETGYRAIAGYEDLDSAKKYYDSINLVEDCCDWKSIEHKQSPDSLKWVIVITEKRTGDCLGIITN